MAAPAPLVDFIERGPAITALLDRDLTYLAVSASWIEVFGRGHEHLIGRSHLEVNPDIPEAWKAELGRALAGAEVRRGAEERWFPAGGVERWLRRTLLPWHDEHGAVGGVIVSAEDVSRERALRLPAARLSAILSMSMDAILTHDLDRNVTFFNGAAERIFGYSATEVLGRPIDMLLPERLRVAHALHVMAFHRGEAGARPMGRGTSVVGRRKNGEEFLADASLSKVDVDGQTFVTVIVRDMTERERACREALATVVHDLRNPLNAIVLHAQRLRRENEPEHREQSLRAIRRTVARMTQLIEDLLDIARLENGQRLTVARKVVSPAQLVRQMIEEHEEWVAESSRRLAVDVAPDLPDVLADDGRLHQVFDNLLGNAIKFSRSNTTISVGAARRDADVVFRVTNDGVIGGDALAHVFEPFWKGSAEDRRGAGLGLSIVKHIVDAHGGRVWIESEPERGTTVSFAIPAATATTA